MGLIGLRERVLAILAVIAGVGLYLLLELRAPLLGEHNAQVLRERLGLDPARIAALSASGVLVTGTT